MIAVVIMIISSAVKPHSRVNIILALARMLPD